MFYGDIVTLDEDGIRVRPKALQPIGIFNESRCWGVRVPEVKPKPRKRRHIRPPHLVISPFHPVSWPFLIRLELKLKHEPGALYNAANLLQSKGINLLYAQCTPSGSMHATCNIIGEATTIRGKFQADKEELDRKYPFPRVESREKDKKAAYQAVRDLANNIAREMFYCVARLRKEVLDPEDKKSHNPHTFLHDRIVNHLQYLYDPDELRESDGSKPDDGVSAHEQAEMQLPIPVSAQWLYNLPFFALYGGGQDTPFALKYDGNSSSLKFDCPEVLRNFPEYIHDSDLADTPDPLGALPTLAIASYDTYEHYARFIPVPRRTMNRKVTRIEVTYRIPSPHNKKGDAAAGLLAEIGHRARQEGVNLLHVSNKVTESGYDHESGSISLLGEFEREPVSIKSSRTQLEEKLKSIDIPRRKQSEEDERDVGQSNLQITCVEVIPYRVRELFVSMKFDHPRHKFLCDTIKQAASRAGFTAYIVETFTKRATETISRKMSECQAFLQLLMFREDEDPDNVGFSWLDFEYGMATGLNLARIRLVDVVRRPYEWWLNRLGTDRDQYVKKFRTDLSDDKLEDIIQKAVNELAKDLDER